MRRLWLWTALLLMLGCAGCTDDERAPLGGGGVTGGGGTPGNTSGQPSTEDGTDGTDDATGDDTETESETDPFGGCGLDEVAEISDGEAIRCWRRCPVGQIWEDEICGGTVEYGVWSWAATVCALTSSRYRTASRAELMGLLGGCDAAIEDSGVAGVCDPCAVSDLCVDLFDVDTQSYWAGTVTGGLSWAVDFESGAVFSVENANAETHSARCVRTL